MIYLIKLSFLSIIFCAHLLGMNKQVVKVPTNNFATAQQYHDSKYREWHTPEVQSAYEQLVTRGDKKPLEKLACTSSPNRYAQWLLADRYLAEKNQAEAKRYLISMANDYRDADAQLDLALLLHDEKEYWAALQCAKRAAISRPIEDAKRSIRYQNKQAVKLVELLESELIDVAKNQSIECQLRLVKQLTDRRQDDASIVYQKSLQLVEQLVQKNELWDTHFEIIEQKNELTPLGKMLHSIVEKKFAEKKYADGVSVLERYVTRGNNPLLIDLLAQGYTQLTRTLYDHHHLKAIELAERRLLEADHFDSLCVLADAWHLGTGINESEIKRIKSSKPEVAAKLRKQLAKNPLAVIDKIKRLGQIEQLPTVQEIDQLALQAVDLPAGIGLEDYRHFLKAFVHFCKAEYQLADVQYQTIAAGAESFFAPLAQWNSAIARKAVSDKKLLDEVNACAETFAGKVEALLDEPTTKPFAYLFLKKLVALTIDLLGEFRINVTMSDEIDFEWQAIIRKNDEISVRLLDRYASGLIAEPEHHIIQLLCHAFTDHSRRAITADRTPFYLAHYVKKLKSRIDHSQQWDDDRGLLLLLDAELSSGLKEDLRAYSSSDLGKMMGEFKKLEKPVSIRLMNERKSSWHAILACNELIKIKDLPETEKQKQKLSQIGEIFEKVLAYDPADETGLHGYLYCLSKSGLSKYKESHSLSQNLVKKFSQASERARFCLASALIAESPICRYSYSFLNTPHSIAFTLNNPGKRETGIKMLKELAKEGAVEAMELLGKCLYDLKMPEALVFLKQAHDKESRKYVSCIADLLCQQKEYTEAQKLLESLQAKNAQNHFLLGSLYCDKLGGGCSNEKALQNLARGFEKNSINLPTSISGANKELIQSNELAKKMLGLAKDIENGVSAAERERGYFAYATYLYWSVATFNYSQEISGKLVKNADEIMSKLDKVTYQLPIAITKLIHQMRTKQKNKTLFGSGDLDEIVEKLRHATADSSLIADVVAKDIFSCMIDRLGSEYDDLFRDKKIATPDVLAEKHGRLAKLKRQVMKISTIFDQPEKIKEIEQLLHDDENCQNTDDREKKLLAIFDAYSDKESEYMKLISVSQLLFTLAAKKTNVAEIESDLQQAFEGVKEALQLAEQFAKKPEAQVRLKQTTALFLTTVNNAVEKKQIDKRVANKWRDEIEQLKSICWG